MNTCLKYIWPVPVQMNFINQIECFSYFYFFPYRNFKQENGRFRMPNEPEEILSDEPLERLVNNRAEQLRISNITSVSKSLQKVIIFKLVIIFLMKGLKISRFFCLFFRRICRPKIMSKWRQIFYRNKWLSLNWIQM